MRLRALTIDQIQRISATAEALNAKYPSDGRAISANDIDMDEVTAYANDEKELIREIGALSPDARAELKAIMWIGRDGENDFAAVLAHARSTNSDEGDIPYIAEKAPSLPMYLKEGLRLIGR